MWQLLYTQKSVSQGEGSHFRFVNGWNEAAVRAINRLARQGSLRKGKVVGGSSN
jgi:hypothetical protein